MEQEYENSQFINKKHFVLSMILLVALMITLFLSVFIALNGKIANSNQVIKEVTVPVYKDVETVTPDYVSYTVKAFDGKVGVYKNDDFQYTLDIYVFTLPKEDQKLLNQGILATSEQELNDILSAYY